ncbi:MAG: hypothetical protein V3W52_17330 [Syntrophobacteria bacterium]
MSFFNNQPATSAFGEALSVSPFPVAQILGTGGLNGQTLTFTNATGTATNDGSEYIVSTGTNAAAFASIITKRILPYRPGEGSNAKLTARFTTGVADSQQIAGVNNSTDGFNFGYQNDLFGIIYRHDGINEIQELQVTTPAAGAENATITIDGTGYTVPLTAGTVQHNADEIAISLNAQVPNYSFTQNDDTVVAVDLVAEVVAGAFAFTSATAVAAWTQIRVGVMPTETFIAQTTWNQDTFAELIPTNGNVYMIQWQYLGYGDIDFFIERKGTKELVLVHRIEYANSFTQPSVTNPAFGLGWNVSNRGNTTDLVVAGASAGAFTEGFHVITEPAAAQTNTLVSAGLVQTPILSLRNRLVNGADMRNLAELEPIFITGFTDSSKGALLQIVTNGTLTGADWAYVDKTSSITELDTSATAVTGGETIDVAIPPTGSETLDMTKLNYILQSNDTVTITGAVIAAPAADITSTIIYQEDL